MRDAGRHGLLPEIDALQRSSRDLQSSLPAARVQRRRHRRRACTHARRVRPQLEVKAETAFDTLVFGLPDLSPYSVGTRINPVLVVSDVLGYIFNWFYDKPFVKKGGVVILLNPVLEFFHPEYHVAYRKFYDEVLPETNDPFEMQTRFQERFARDPHLIDAYRNRWAHHGFHPFTVWYWATWPLRSLSRVIVVGPPNDRVTKRLGVDWSPNLAHALAKARELTGGDHVVALTVPPFMYLHQNGTGAS